jgi:hypothetical protein
MHEESPTVMPDLRRASEQLLQSQREQFFSATTSADRQACATAYQTEAGRLAQAARDRVVAWHGTAPNVRAADHHPPSREDNPAGALLA